MEYGSMIGSSMEYAKDAVWGKWTRWVLLVISTIIFPLILGYIMEIYRGATPAPEMEHWGKKFIDGLKFLVAALIYAIPVLIVIFLFIGIAILAFMPFSSTMGYTPMNPALIAGAIAGVIVGIIIAIVVGILVTLFSTIGLVRMAREDRFGEAFNFGAILATIRRIGWGNYIVALIVLWIISLILGLILGALAAIPFIGWLIWLFLFPLLLIFESRYVTQIYDAAGPETKSKE
ncbi:DUF4013 domain-containing protein [Methanolinea mesophila]|uniref:DUF4013 domain-containing protein n=1 Tax=Methanolinea mesophila TaxID=547055 RepID=UPI001AE129A5|nr:DUF4013 domain-containing protein [Methanolinea mesophila]